MQYIGSAQSGKQTNMCTCGGGGGWKGDERGGWVIITANPVSMDPFSVCSLRKQEFLLWRNALPLVGEVGFFLKEGSKCYLKMIHIALGPHDEFARRNRLSTSAASTAIPK